MSSRDFHAKWESSTAGRAGCLALLVERVQRPLCSSDFSAGTLASGAICQCIGRIIDADEFDARIRANERRNFNYPRVAPATQRWCAENV